jgi:TatD DNase family protein
MFTDSHTHFLEMHKKGLDIKAEIKKLEELGFSFVLDAGISAGDLDERMALVSAYPFIHFSAGIHPNHCSLDQLENDINILEIQCAGGKVKALGETGLDFFRAFSSTKDQEAFFIEQLQLANRSSLPVIIHSRDAEKKLLELLHQHKPAYSGIIHCYSSDKESLKKYLDLGFFISFAGNISYKKAESLREALKYTPSERLFLETDAPYLSPQTLRNELNRSSFIIHTYSCAAQIKETSVEELAGQLKSNFRRLFNISSPK